MKACKARKHGRNCFLTVKKQIQERTMSVIYKENCTVFGRVTCTSCGTNTDLIHIEKQILKPTISTFEDTICLDCWKEMPSASDTMELIEDEILKVFDVEDLVAYETFDEFWANYELPNYDRIWNDDQLIDFYKSVFYKLRSFGKTKNLKNKLFEKGMLAI